MLRDNFSSPTQAELSTDQLAPDELAPDAAPETPTEDFAASETQATTTAIMAPPHERRRILVVESEGSVSNELARLMEEVGHTVQVAADAKTALLELQEFSPHLVLLGTYLADMPGYELSSILHGAPQYSHKFRHVGLLFVADRHKLLKHRFVGAPDVPIARYIFKPINPVEVRDKVARTLREGVM